MRDCSSLIRTRRTVRAMDEQTPEEMRAHYGERGPVAAAWNWCLGIADTATFADAWCKHTGEPLRSAVAESFVEVNLERPWMYHYDPETLGAALAACDPPDEDVWELFVEAQAATFAEAVGPINSGDYGAASRPRPLGVGLELVLFVPTPEGIHQVREPTVVVAQAATMERQDGRWVVIGWNDPQYAYAALDNADEPEP